MLEKFIAKFLLAHPSVNTQCLAKDRAEFSDTQCIANDFLTRLVVILLEFKQKVSKYVRPVQYGFSPSISQLNVLEVRSIPHVVHCVLGPVTTTSWTLPASLSVSPAASVQMTLYSTMESASLPGSVLEKVRSK